MHFGIMTMLLEYLVPADKQGDQLAAHLASFDYAQLVRSLAESGFRLLELGGDMSLFFPQAFQPHTIKALDHLREELGLTYTVHLPLWSIEPSTPAELVRQGSAEAVTAIILATQSLQPHAYVLHATGALAAEFYRMRIPPQAKALLLQLLKSKAEQSLASILSQTKIQPRLLALETIEFPFELTLAMAENYDLSLCLDTGHVLSGFSGPMTVYETLEKSKHRLAEVHLHDAVWQGPECNVVYGQDHRPLGKGDLDLPRFLDQLRSANFRGPVIFELQVGEALESLRVVKSVRPELLST